MTTDGNHQNDINQSEALDLAREYPAVTFQGLTFSDDTTVQLDPTDVVIFVGPNNAGKSVALRELEERLRDQPIETIVVKSAARHDTGTSKGFPSIPGQVCADQGSGGQPCVLWLWHQLNHGRK